MNLRRKLFIYVVYPVNNGPLTVERPRIPEILADADIILICNERSQVGSKQSDLKLKIYNDYSIDHQSNKAMPDELRQSSGKISISM